ncbi:hypothetical protein [Leptotrichia sp. OH3620_COT-345]|uniref:hypothetical protein n=1 Tax=Leptotrichia sp. OH3620_COT-345 TaxID=2491048 RepID=UPI001F27239F|nr:hypothetical protein [Leptotrichia sp. OH3620_COT-345]
MKCYYHISKRGELWGGYCSIVNAEKYHKNYSQYLMNAINTIDNSDINENVRIIEQIENEEIESYESAIEIFGFKVTKDKVYFEYFWEDDDDWKDWQCTFEEYKKALIGWKEFLKMPRDINSYLEVEINDI